MHANAETRSFPAVMPNSENRLLNARAAGTIESLLEVADAIAVLAADAGACATLRDEALCLNVASWTITFNEATPSESPIKTIPMI